MAAAVSVAVSYDDDGVLLKRKGPRFDVVFVKVKNCCRCSVGHTRLYCTASEGLTSKYEYGFDQQRLIWYVYRLWDIVFS